MKQSIFILAAAAAVCGAQTKINWTQIQNAPSTDNSRPLGDPTHRFSNIYTFNLYSSGQVNLSGGSFTLPIGAGLTPTSSGQIGYDSTANIIRAGFGGASRILATITGTPADNDCMKYSAATNTITTAGAACGSGGGGGGGGFNLISTGTNTGAVMTVGTGASLTFTGTGVVNASQLNGTAFSGFNGDLVSFGAANIPADSGILAANVVRNSQANTWTGGGLQSLSSVDLLMPTHATDPATCTAGQIEFNSAGAVGKICTVANTWATITTGAVGTGNAAANVTTTFSATPTFTCPSASGGTIVNFALSTSLTANITSSTLATCTAGSLLNFVFVQDATGGRTVVMPTGFDALTIHPAAGITTKVSYFLDAGGNGRLLGAVSTAGYGSGAEVAAPGTPPAGACYTWYDSTANVPSWKCNGATTASNSAQTIASGQTAMPTTALAANTCSAAATTATATGTLTTDAPIVAFASDPSGVTGYGTSGGIVVNFWPTANTVNFKLCNPTSASITPGAINVNWRVAR